MTVDPVISIDVVHLDPFDKLHKIKLNKDAKTPINKWSNPKNHVQTVNTDIYNVGLPTGKINNILVIDIDVNKENKKENGGMDKINEYIKQFGDINTLETITPSGGRHYYFKYDSSIPDIQYIMKKSFIHTCRGWWL